MSGSILEFLLANPLSLLVAVFFLGLSILVHELGHYLAARWRGMIAPRFSIGLGPKICGWTDKHGTEFCLSWIPLGGYVALPQLADMGELEGGDAAAAKALPPARYLDKVIVSAAGAVFNVLFAFVLATIIWQVGEPSSATAQTTTIGHVAPTITLSDNRAVPSPASEAGMLPGDVIRSIDGRPVAVWDDVVQALVMGAGRTGDGRRSAAFGLERNGQPLVLTVHPQLASDEKIRRVGISAAGPVLVDTVAPGSKGAKAGLRPGDTIEAINGTRILGPGALDGFFTANKTQPLTLTLRRDGASVEVLLPAGSIGEGTEALGVEWITQRVTIHVDPFRQLVGQFKAAYRTIWSLINPNSDIGLSKMSGPIGIITVFAAASVSGFLAVLSVTILINVALAVFNLLPIPVLDGGHIVFATIAKLRGRPLPLNIVASLQMTFVVLLLSMMLYVSAHDVRRISRGDSRPPAEQKQPDPKSPAAPAAEPVPAKP